MAHEHIVYMMLADASAQSRDAANTRSYAEKLEDLASRDEHLPYLAVAQRAQGIAYQLDGDLAEANKRLDEALGLFDELEMPWQIGRTLTDLAELALASAEQGAARDYLGRALEAFESLGATPDIERTRLALDAVT